MWCVSHCETQNETQNVDGVRDVIVSRRDTALYIDTGAGRREKEESARELSPKTKDESVFVNLYRK